MRIQSTTLWLLVSVSVAAQVDYEDIQLDYGTYEVGYKHLELVDSSRRYTAVNGLGVEDYRPVSVSVWQPANTLPSAEQLTVGDYLTVLQTEEEWPDLPFDYFFDWFSIRRTAHNEAQVQRRTRAMKDFTPTPTPRPVILYTASYRASSTENFALGEYLASHGYTVVALPSKGYANINFEGGTIRDATAQSNDLDFVIDRLGSILGTQPTELILSGFSFGGLSHIINAANHPAIKGIVSLDGTVKYRPEILEQSPQFSYARFTVPFIHFSQKDITATELLSDGLDTLFNDRFIFFDTISVPYKCQVKASVLSHQYFATYGLLFSERDTEHDHGYAAIRSSYGALLKNVRLAISTISGGVIDVDEFEQSLTASGKFNVVASAAGPAAPPTVRTLLAPGDSSDAAALLSRYRTLQGAPPRLYGGGRRPKYSRPTIGF